MRLVCKDCGKAVRRQPSAVKDPDNYRCRTCYIKYLKNSDHNKRPHDFKIYQRLNRLALKKKIKRNRHGNIDIKCRKCGYEWEYTGKSEHYARCPSCRRQVILDLMYPKDWKNRDR